MPLALSSTTLVFVAPALFQVTREAKLSLLSGISISGDPQLSELGLQLHLVNAYLQTQDLDYNILSEAHSQLSSFPMACPLGCYQSMDVPDLMIT